MFQPIAASLALAMSFVLEKCILTKRRIGVIAFNEALFMLMFVMMLPLAVFFFRVSDQAFTFYGLMTLLIASGIAALYNILLYYGLKGEDVNEAEVFSLTIPLFVAILAAIFFIDERKWQVLVAVVVSSAALMFSHLEKKHLRINKYSLAILGHAALVGVEALFIKKLLLWYSPYSLYMFRCGVIAIILIIIFKPRFKHWTSKSFKLLMVSNALVITAFTFTYWAYNLFGMVFTSLIMNLVPVFVFIFSWWILKEKIRVQNVVAAGIIIASITWVLLV